MNFSIIGHTKDLRTNTFIIYAQIGIDDYLTLVGEKFADFFIQRKREKHKAYARMKKDIIAGSVLPPITLAFKENAVNEIIPYLKNGDFNSTFLYEKITNPNQVLILDGMQRTYILNDIKNEGIKFNKEQKLLVEFWVEQDIDNLIYRLIILNAGQKAMSLRHQLDLLFSTMYENIKKEIPNLTLIRERDNERRSQAREFSFEHLVLSYYCFLAKNYTPNKENIVAQEIQDEGIIYADRAKFAESFYFFKKYLKKYTDLDEKIYNFYTLEDKNFLAKEHIMNAFFAALSSFAGDDEEKYRRIDKALEKICQLLNSTKPTQLEIDPIGIKTYQKITAGIPSAKKNIGIETKRIVHDAFREFFNSEGNKSMSDCWQFATQ